MRTIIGILSVLLIAVPGIAFSQEVVRQNVLLGVGEQIVYQTRAPIATVTTPPHTNDAPNEIVRITPEQYGQSIVIRGMKRGEVKLLVENTTARIGEVVNVTVIDKALAARYRNVTAAMSAVNGISPSDILATSKVVAITGMTYSAADATRCLGQEAQSKGAVVCAARLDSAAPVVLPAAGFSPMPSFSIREQYAQANGGEVTGGEASSTWTLEMRLGDVPVAQISSKDRVALVERGAQFTTRLRRAIAEWKNEATTRQRIYPVLVSARHNMTGYDIAMQWRLDQGTKPDPLVSLTFDELQNTAISAGTSSDRLVQWWAALLQDAFRLYFMASTPLRTSSAAADNPLQKLYEQTLRVDTAPLSRDNSPVRVARAYTAMRWPAGSDPFASLLTRVPASFTGLATAGGAQ